MTENIPKKAGGNQDFRRQAHSYCMVTAKAAQIAMMAYESGRTVREIAARGFGAG